MVCSSSMQSISRLYFDGHQNNIIKEAIAKHKLNRRCKHLSQGASWSLIHSSASMWKPKASSIAKKVSQREASSSLSTVNGRLAVAKRMTLVARYWSSCKSRGEMTKGVGSPRGSIRAISILTPILARNQRNWASCKKIEIQ